MHIQPVISVTRSRTAFFIQLRASYKKTSVKNAPLNLTSPLLHGSVSDAAIIPIYTSTVDSIWQKWITLKAKIEQHISLIKRETPQVSLADIPLMQKKLVDLKQILATMSDLRKSFRGQRGKLMEAGNRFLLARLCEAAYAINERHIYLLPKAPKSIDRKQIVAPLQNFEATQPHSDVLLLSKSNALDHSYHQDIHAMYTSLQSVHSLYAEIQALVLHQGEQIEHILTNLENAAINTELGTHQVEVRVGRERVNTKILAMMLITAIIFLSTLTMIYNSGKGKLNY